MHGAVSYAERMTCNDVLLELELTRFANDRELVRFFMCNRVSVSFRIVVQKAKRFYLKRRQAGLYAYVIPAAKRLAYTVE